MAGLQELVQVMLKAEHFLDIDIVKKTLVHSKQRDRHQRHRQRCVLCLLQQFGNACAAIQLLAGGVIEIGSKLRECRQFAVLRKVGTNTAGQAFNNFGLCSTTNARHRNTGVNRRTNARVEQ